jgi:hypothetical protein
MRSKEVVRQVRGKVFLPRLVRGRSTARRILRRRVRGRLARIPVIRRRDKPLTIIKISFSSSTSSAVIKGTPYACWYHSLISGGGGWRGTSGERGTKGEYPKRKLDDVGCRQFPADVEPPHGHPQKCSGTWRKMSQTRGPSGHPSPGHDHDHVAWEIRGQGKDARHRQQQQQDQQTDPQMYEHESWRGLS